MDADIGITRLDIRPFATIFAEAVADRVLDAQGDEIKRLERTLDGGRHDAHGARDIEMVGPQLAYGQMIDIVFLEVRPLDDVAENTRRDAGFQIGAVAGQPVTGEKHAAVRCLQLAGTHRG